MRSRRIERYSGGHGPRVRNGAKGRIWFEKERRAPNACGGSLGRPANHGSEYQVPAEYDRTKRLYLDPPCEVESHEGFAPAHASLRRGASLHTRGPSGRSWLTIARWSKQACRSAHRITAPDTTTQWRVGSSQRIQSDLTVATTSIPMSETIQLTGQIPSV